MANHREPLEEVEVDRIFDSFNCEFLSFNDFLGACAVKTIVKQFAFIPDLVFNRLASGGSLIHLQSIENALGTAFGDTISPMNKQTFLAEFFSPDVIADGTATEAVVLIGSIHS